MSQVATTKMSSKGQVVIPEDIRDKMGLHSGDQFLVLAEKDVVILKIVTRPSMNEYKNLITKARNSAKAAGMTSESIKSAIKVARKK